MEHPRKIIRQTIVGMIAAGETDAAARVFDTRDFALNTETTPAITVYTQDERLVDQEQQDFGMRRRVMTVSVECYHTGDAGAEAIDRIAWQVENIIHANPTLQNKAEWCRLLKTKMAFSDNSEPALHSAVLSFEVIYYTHLYESDGQPPVTVLYGFDPDTGQGNEDKYIGADNHPAEAPL